LAPGDPDREVQFIDVRDLGAWCVHLAVTGKCGVWNAVGLPMRLSMQELLHACKTAQNADARFTWVAEELLLAEKVRPYAELPLWLPSGQRGHIDNRRAVRDGLTFRTVADTIAATLAWFARAAPGGRELRAGLQPERERDLLARWRERK
jgi:2'-hydroxyisoflavone reductase